MIMANILCNYEIKLPNGVTERYENIKFGAGVSGEPPFFFFFYAT